MSITRNMCYYKLKYQRLIKVGKSNIAYTNNRINGKDSNKRGNQELKE